MSWKENKKLRLYAKFRTLNYKGDVEVIKQFVDLNSVSKISSEIIMKHLNDGDILKIPSPITLLSITQNNIFSNIQLKIRYCESIETETINGNLKFVVYKNGNKVERWEYSNGDDNGQA